MKIINALLTIDGKPFQCLARSIKFEPDTDDQTLCTDSQEFTLNVDLKLTYGANGSYNVLSAMAGQAKVHVLQPLNGPASVNNPKWTFTGIVPVIPKMDGEPSKTGKIDYTTTSDGGVTEVFA